MARISNTTAYSSIIPTLPDYFVLTDAENNLNTKTCTLENLQTLFGLNTTSVTIAIPETYLKVIAAQPYTLLAPPGDGYVYDVSEIVSLMIPGSTPYNFVNTLNMPLYLPLTLHCLAILHICPCPLNHLVFSVI